MSDLEADEYSRVQDVLDRSQADADAAECQGGLCGILCATSRLSGPEWAVNVLSGGLACSAGGVTEEMLAEHRPRAEDVAALADLYTRTLAEMEDPDYGFYPLLPDDDIPLPERARALGLWCQGVLLGLGLGGVQETSALPPEAVEVMHDLAELSKLGHEGDDLEEGENAYAEIVEYVRMGVLVIREELRPLRERQPPDAPVRH